MATLTQQQLTQNIEALETQGASQSEIQEYLNSQSQKPEKTRAKSLFRPRELGESIIGAAKEEFGASSKAIQEAQQRQARGKQGLARTLTTELAQGAQAGLSTAFRGVLSVGSALIPDFIENPLRRKIGAGFESFIQSEQGQRFVSGIQGISEKIDTLEPKNKQLVKDVADTLLTGVDLASFGAGGIAGRRVLATVGEKAGVKGRGLVSRAEEDIQNTIENKLANLVIDETTPTRRTALATRTK
ncbi:MAG TPA: hypothetical protein ENI23_03295, partial [bacterium]|nr:hypothetical protein [bacterium]